MTNIWKGPITSVIGLIIILGSVYAVEFIHKIDWVWNGLIGVGIGAVLFFVPDKIPGFLSSVLDKKEKEL